MQKNLDEIRKELTKTRDELKLQAHLFKGEVEDTWKSAENKWQEFEGKVKNLKTSAQASKDDVGAALDILKDEIQNSYQRIRSSIN